MPHSPNVSPSATAMTLHVCSYNAVSDTATVVYDLNDHTTTYLHAKSLAIAVPPQIETRSGNMRAQGEIVAALQYQNRHISMKIMVTGTSSAAVESSVAALINAVKNENLPYCLALAWPGMATYKYADVVRCKYTTPTDPQEIQSRICRNITLDFECRPGLRGDRVTLQNLVMNPGFEGPAGGGVATTMPTVFSDSFANTNAYSVVSGGAPSLSPANTYVDIVQANIPASGAILRYARLDETSGTTAYDIGGSAQNGTTHGSPTQGVAGLISGDTDTCYTFANASSQYVSFPNTGLPTGNAAWSIAIWFKFAANPASALALASMGGTASKAGCNVYVDTSGKLNVDLNGGTGLVTSASAATTGTAHLACATWDGTTLRLYLDGASVGTPTTPGTLAFVAGACNIGAGASNGTTWTGQLDEGVFYSGALSAAQITAIWNAGHSGATGTVAGAMSIPAAGQVKFGSPAWGAIQTWQTRFRWVTGLTNASWYLHYTDANNYVRAWLSGTSLNLEQKVAGVTNTLATAVTIALTHEAWYWLQATQFPSVPGSPPYIQAVLLADNEGVVGAQIASIGGSTNDTLTALSGQPQLAATGAALVLGGNFSNTHAVSLFGPGAWSVASSGTGVASGAWDGSNAGAPTSTNTNPYQGGPVTSYGAARMDAAAAGTLNAQWIAGIIAAAAGVQQTTQPISSAGDVLGVSAWVKSSGVGAGCAQSLQIVEYNSSGAQLRTGSVAGASVSGAQASWTQLAGTYTTGANCAYAALMLSAVDATAGSVNGTVWWDNAQVWDQTTTGATSMSYHELRFPNSPAQLMVSGLVGDLPTPAFAAMAAYVPTWSPGANNKLTYALGRRAQSAQSALLLGWLADSTQSATAALDATSYAGYYLTIPSGTMGAGYEPYTLSAPLNALKGAYHLWLRAQTANATPSKVSAQVVIDSTDGPYEAIRRQNDEYVSGALYPFSAQNTWTVVDAGQALLPAFPRSALTDTSQQYADLGPALLDTNTSAASGRLNWSALLPIDSSLWLGTAQPNIIPAQPWYWVYVDGTQVNTNAPSSAASANADLETRALVNPGNAASGPGAYITSGIGASFGTLFINGVADPFVTLDPTLSTPTSNGVNQFGAFITDQNATVYPFVGEIVYAPLYLTLR